MKLLVFGKIGQVATELQRLAGAGLHVEALPQERADLTQPEECASLIAQTNADAVINAAAYTAVDRAEEEEALAMLINATAPEAMARACADKGVPFLHISTDYVFDGSGDAAWTTQDATGPINAYGRSKLAGDQAVLAAGGNAAILRTSWVFSAHGTNFVKTMLRLADTHDALTVVGDQIGGPTPAADIAAALVSMARAMVDGQQGGLYHFSGQPAASWANFAREIFRQASRDVTVTDIPTDAYPTPAKRPLNSRLDCSKLEEDFGISPPDWTRGLAQVLNDLKQGSRL
ncbi:dTDP-4-dehydrorhamnose reductase [Aliiroseovarius crassostreae]|uniref:dTDP-4-dehydrorhamnose reductase n=1 Tax=Aliiroseovarius crassostreae TaxID=154981 RepID=UPI003C7DAAED